MQLQLENDDLGLCPSFNCYFLDSMTAMAAAKVSREFKQEQTAQLHQEFTDIDEDEFEFSQELSESQVSCRQIDLEHRRQFVFPVLDSALQSTKGGLDLEVEESDYASSDSFQLQKFYANKQDHESFSSSSSEANEFGGILSGFLCMWSPNVSSSPSRKCKKRGSTGSDQSHGSRRYWRIHNFLHRSSSDGEESTFFLRPNKTDSTKQNRNVNNSGEITKVAGESISKASSPSFHELFYVKKRAQEKRDKMRSFLPYRQDLVGFFVNINRIRNRKSSF